LRLRRKANSFEFGRAGWCLARYEADGLGSLTSLTDPSGALAASYTYDSFGNSTASTGSLTNPFRYTAREFDPETCIITAPGTTIRLPGGFRLRIKFDFMVAETLTCPPFLVQS